MPKAVIKYIVIFLFVLSIGMECSAKADNDNKFIVVIDAGHGGKDVGATDNGVKEKDINLKVAKYLESMIKKKLKNSKVEMTRNDDSFLSLQQRADKANKSHGDIFISIHTNSVAKTNKNRKNIEGSAVYTLGLNKEENNLDVAMRENSVIELEQDYEKKYSGFDPQRDESYIIFEMAQKKNMSQSIKLAENIEKELVKAGRQDRGVHQAGFWVLWATSMPSVLVELDFICNPKSAQYISSDKGAKELAEAIFKAVKTYEESWTKSIKAINMAEADNRYSDNDEPELEDYYTVISSDRVAKARTRTHKTVSEKGNYSTTKNSSNNKRKRRSSSSRLLSMKNSYEKNDLFFPEIANFAAPTKAIANEGIVAMETSSKSQKNKAKDKKKEDKKSEKNNKKKAEKAPKLRKEDAHNAKLNKLVTVYKIQILASADLLNNDNSRFCGLSPISTFKENNLYKYYYGESTDRAELESILKDVQKKIPDAFIVSSTKSVQSNK